MKKLFLVALGLGLLFPASYTAYVLTRPERVIGLGERIHHDDFEYSVVDVKKMKSIGEGENPVAAKGVFYIVTLKVENRAIRVDHEWDISMAYVEDESGRKYERSLEGQEARDEAQGIHNAALHTTPPGVSETADVVFDLPADAKNPCLKIWKDVLMGDMFDGIAYRKVKVQL